MFSKEELLVIEDALKIADNEYMRLLEENRNNKNRMVAYNRKQKSLWLVQNKLKKILQENREKQLEIKKFLTIFLCIGKFKLAINQRYYQNLILKKIN